jgi:hypothetical protein
LILLRASRASGLRDHRARPELASFFWSGASGMTLSIQISLT